MTNESESNQQAGAKPHEATWIETVETEIEEIVHQPPEVLLRHALYLDLPYIIMLSMAVLGIGLVTFTGQPVLDYWLFLTPLYGAICVYAGWRHTQTRTDRIKLIVTQALHWAAFLVAMWLIYLPTIRDVVNNNATGLNLMTLLALATFVAGVHAEAWQICIIGIILAVTVPAMAFVQQSALFTTVVLLGALMVAGTLWLTFHKEKNKRAAASRK